MAFGIAPSGALVAARATYQLGRGRGAGPNRDARMTAPQEMTKARESWSGVVDNSGQTALTRLENIGE
jgi:hypothetical protein